MANIITHKVKRFFQKIAIDSHKKLVKQHSIPLSPYEKEVLTIVRRLSRLPESELLVDPNNGKRYLYNEQSKINIIVNDGTVDIIHSGYLQNVPVCYHTRETILNIVDGQIGVRREKRESEIRSTIKHSLETIMNSIKL